MAYGEKYYVEHIADVDGNSRTYRIEILQDGFGGATTELKGWGGAGVATLEFERLDREQIFRGIAQKGRLELHVAVQDSSDLSVLTDIFEADEDEYQLRLKEDGTVKWTGFCIPDMIQYSEGDYPFNGTITAKDLSLLESLEFETNTAINYETYATLFGTLLNDTGLNLDIHSYNDWTAFDISDTDDYFNQIYVDKFQLQNFSSYSQGSFEPINYLQALNEILPPGFIVRQYNNVWNIMDVSYLAKSGGTVDRYEYDSSGSQTGSSSSISLTEDVDRVDNYVMPSSVRDPWRPIKQLRLEYNHKTSIQNLLFESEYTVNADNTTEFKSESIKVSDTSNRQFSISGDIEVTTDTDPGSFRSGDAQILIQVDDQELDISAGTFGVNVGEEDVQVGGNDNTLTGSIDVNDAVIPTDITEATLTVEFRFATVSGETVQSVKWKNFEASIVNGDDVADSASQFFRLEQSGNYSPKKEIPRTIIGQGPDDESNSALRYFSSGATYELATTFKHTGETGVQYEEFILTNLLGLQRNSRKAINANLRALYRPLNLLVYDTDNYLFLDGRLSVKEAQWDATLVELKFASGSNTFSESLKITDADAGSTVALSSGTNSVAVQNKRFLNSQKITTTTAELSGTVTSIPINSVGVEFITVDQVFYVFDAEGTGSVTEFTLSEPQQANDTSLSVDSKSISGHIRPDAWIIFTGEKISSYITQTDEAVRIGVRDYELATTLDDETVQTSDGEQIEISGDNQEAVNQGYSSEIAVLKGQIVLKTTYDGRVAAVDINSKPEEGSEITLQADQINIEGVLNAINDNTTTTIDGGKITAESSITVGTGNNVAVLSGVNDTYRIWAGDATAASAPFRVQQDGTVIATSVVTLEGDGTGEVNNLNLVNLGVTGTITVDTGEIKTIDTKTISGFDYDLTGLLKDGEFTLTITDSSDNDDQVLITANASSGVPEVQTVRHTGQSTRIQPGNIVLDRGVAGSTVQLRTSSASGFNEFLVVASDFVDTTSRTGLTEYLKVLVDGNERYIQLYS